MKQLAPIGSKVRTLKGRSLGGCAQDPAVLRCPIVKVGRVRGFLL